MKLRRHQNVRIHPGTESTLGLKKPHETKPVENKFNQQACKFMYYIRINLIFSVSNHIKLGRLKTKAICSIYIHVIGSFKKMKLYDMKSTISSTSSLRQKIFIRHAHTPFCVTALGNFLRRRRKKSNKDLKTLGYSKIYNF